MVPRLNVNLFHLPPLSRSAFFSKDNRPYKQDGPLSGSQHILTRQNLTFKPKRTRIVRNRYKRAPPRHRRPYLKRAIPSPPQRRWIAAILPSSSAPTQTGTGAQPSAAIVECGTKRRRSCVAITGMFRQFIF